jgi:hypothetical protein
MSDRTALERGLSRRLSGVLGRWFGCFDFRESGGDYRLTIELNRLNATARGADEVDFWIYLRDQNGQLMAEKVPWTYRVLNDYNLQLERSTFQTDLCLTFESILQDPNKREMLTDHVLGHLRLSDHAYPIPKHRDWAMPFSNAEAGIGDGSRLRIDTRYREEVAIRPQLYDVQASGDTREIITLPENYRGKIFGQTLSPLRARWPEELRVEGVYLITYERFSPAPGMLGPLASSSSVCVP